MAGPQRPHARAPVRSDMHAAPHGDAHKDCTVHRCINNRAMMHTEGQWAAKGVALHDPPPPEAKGPRKGQRMAIGQ